MKKKHCKLLRKIINPSGKAPRFIFIATLFFCIITIVLFLQNSSYVVFEILKFIFLIISIIMFIYSVYIAIVYARLIKTDVKNILLKTSFGKKLLTHYGYRTIIFSSFSLVINIAYVILNVIIAFTTHSYWHASLAAYYSLLGILRGAVVFHHKNKSELSPLINKQKIKLEEIKKYKNCGIVLAITPFSLTIPIMQIIFLSRAFIYKGWTIFAFATFTLYKIITAINNFRKARKQADLTILAVRNVGLADALVSVFSLQTALLYAFADKPATVANVLTGTFVCLFTVSMGISMAVNANRKLQLINPN